LAATRMAAPIFPARDGSTRISAPTDIGRHDKR
jgi:hypothetical protein